MRLKRSASSIPERLRQPFDVVDADVALAALDRADVGAIQAGKLRQGPLGEAARLPLAPQVGSEQFASGCLGAGFLHATNLRPAARGSLSGPPYRHRKTGNVVRLAVTG